MNISDLELMTPGSVWLKENNKQSVLLFLTNTSIPARHQSKFPSVAVFTDENGDIFSLPVENFLANRTFYNVNPEAEQNIQAVLELLAQGPLSAEQIQDQDIEALFSEDEDTLFVSDGEEQSASSDLSDAFTLATESRVSGETASADMFGVPFIQYKPVQDDKPALVSPERLSELTVSYDQTPELAGNKVVRLLHSLCFRLEPGVSVDDIRNSFRVERLNDNAVYIFSATGYDFEDGKPLEVDWDAYCGCYPYIHEGTAYIKIVLSTEQGDNVIQTESITDITPNDSPVMGTDLVTNVVETAPEVIPEPIQVQVAN